MVTEEAAAVAARVHDQVESDQARVVLAIQMIQEILGTLETPALEKLTTPRMTVAIFLQKNKYKKLWEI